MRRITANEAFGEGREFSGILGSYTKGVLAVVRREDEVLIASRFYSRDGKETECAVFPSTEIRAKEDYRIIAERIVLSQTGIKTKPRNYTLGSSHSLIRTRRGLATIVVPIENGNPWVYTHNTDTGERYGYSICELESRERSEPEEQPESGMKNPRFVPVTQIIENSEMFPPEHEIVVGLLAAAHNGVMFTPGNGDVVVHPDYKVFSKVFTGRDV